jgi:hypothetical protein
MSFGRRLVVVPLLTALGSGCGPQGPSDSAADEIGSEITGDDDDDGDTTTTTSDGDADADTSTTDDVDADTDTDTTDESTDDTTGDDGDIVYDCANPMWDPADFNQVLDVGPGHEFETPSDIEWENIYADTLIRIHWREEPYRDKWVINRSGGGSTPIVVLGVLGDNNEFPEISGDGAVTRPELDFWNEDRAIIKIGGGNPENDPGNIWIECLSIGHAKPGYSFTNAAGEQQEYASNAAAIYAEIGHDLHIRNCELYDAGNGLFTAWQTQNVLVAGNYIHDNGILDSIYEHNSYTESRGITFEFNHYGPLCPGCLGNNLKDRSAGLVVRYNLIEDGNRQLDLVDTDHQEVLDDPRYSTTLVYGNNLIEGPDQGNGQIIHYGGDSGNESWYRKGVLHLYHNTIVSLREDNTTLLRLSSESESADVRNNIVHVTDETGNLAMSDGSGAMILTDNWLTAGWVDTHGMLTGSVMDMGNLESSDPGFYDNGEYEYFYLSDGSMCIGAAGELHPDADPVEWHYSTVPNSFPRPDDGDPDIGAFEL